MRKQAILLALCAALSGCILANQQSATTAKTALIGKSKSDILACAGIPNQTMRDGRAEYLAYYGSGRMRTNGTRFSDGAGGVFYSGSASQAQCVVNIAIRNGRVSAVNYRSSGGAVTAPDEACGVVLKGCL